MLTKVLSLQQIFEHKWNFDIRRDSEGKYCTNINSIMDYDQDYVNKWSTCSVSDFKNWYYDVVNDFGEWGLT